MAFPDITHGSEFDLPEVDTSTIAYAGAADDNFTLTTSTLDLNQTIGAEAFAGYLGEGEDSSLNLIADSLSFGGDEGGATQFALSLDSTLANTTGDRAWYDTSPNPEKVKGLKLFDPLPIEELSTKFSTYWDMVKDIPRISPIHAESGTLFGKEASSPAQKTKSTQQFPTTSTPRPEASDNPVTRSEIEAKLKLTSSEVVDTKVPRLNLDNPPAVLKRVLNLEQQIQDKLNEKP